MAALGYDEYNVVGWSDGAIAAVLLAAKQTKAVGKLVVFGGWCPKCGRRSCCSC